jgi:hypothetical protein
MAPAMTVRALSLLLLATLALPQLNGCATSPPVGAGQVVTGDGYRAANAVIERIPLAFTPMPAADLAAAKELPVRVTSGFLLIDDAGSMRAKGPAPFASRAALAEVLGERLRATLTPPGSYGRETTGPIRLSEQSLRALGGWSPTLVDGLAALAPRLRTNADAGVTTALIIFSRAERVEEPAVRQVRALQDELGERLCVHLVSVGDEAACFLLREFDRCGTAVRGADIASPETMAAYALRLFYGQPPDDDNDGVPNYKDRCPRTGPRVRVNWNGCPFDDAALMRLLPAEVTREGWLLPAPSSL